MKTYENIDIIVDIFNGCVNIKLLIIKFKYEKRKKVIKYK